MYNKESTVAVKVDARRPRHTVIQALGMDWIDGVYQNGSTIYTSLRVFPEQRILVSSGPSVRVCNSTQYTQACVHQQVCAGHQLLKCINFATITSEGTDYEV